MANQTCLTLSQCPVQSVSVFVDRAQITRVCTFRPLGERVGAEYSLIISGLTQSAETDSLRLKVEKGEEKGDEKESKAAAAQVVIVDVSVDTHHNVNAVTQTEREKIARVCLKEVESKEAVLLAALTRLHQQDDFVQSYLRSMLTATGGKNNSPPAVGANLESVSELLQFHLMRSVENDAKKIEIDKELSEIHKQKAAATAELTQISRSAREPQVSVSRDINALLHIPQAVGEVSVSIQYLVRDAFWTPSYDLRYDSKVQGALPSNLVVTYQGVVKQSTGEDWNDVVLSLSTAAPARGGAPPMPPTRIAQIQSRSYLPRPVAVSSMHSNALMPMQSIMQADMRTRRYSTNALELGDVDEPETPSATPVVVREGATNSTFVIDRKATIASDNKEHKVTIAMVALTPDIRFFATPQLEQQAYLQARAVNSSPFPFLSSETASVFIDGSFISKTKMELTAPGENFNLFLGVDAGVKVEHRVLKNTTTKGKEGKMLIKKEPSKKVVEYRTLLHNTKAVAIEITVVELCPRTSDERIVVEILQPTGLVSGGSDAPASGEGQMKVGSVMQNKVTNNVVFSRKLNPGEKMELPFSYSISWPHDAGEVEVV